MSQDDAGVCTMKVTMVLILLGPFETFMYTVRVMS